MALFLVFVRRGLNLKMLRRKKIYIWFPLFSKRRTKCSYTWFHPQLCKLDSEAERSSPKTEQGLNKYLFT